MPEPLTEADEKMERQILWLKLFKAEGEEEVEMLATKSPVLQKTYGVLKKLSADERARLLYESREKARRDEMARLYVAHAEGKAEGRAEGKAEGKAEGRAEGKAEGTALGRREGELKAKYEMAKKLITLGIAPDVIAESSGLPLEEVRNLMAI
jgi:predicted transposase/invertase (TIGR01784 family)